MQAIGMWGAMHTIRRTFGWAVRLMRGKTTRRTEAPHNKMPMRAPDGGPASHALIDPHLPAAGARPIALQVPADLRKPDADARRKLVPATPTS
jgi:hypothetical protein